MNDENAGVSIHAGFPNPATEFSIQELSLDRLLIPRPISTFLLRVRDNNWEEQGIFDGDIAVVDRMLNPRRTDLIIWWQEESFIISKRMGIPPDTNIWGVVTSIVHQYRRKA